jgi:D-alanine-D-alanine ligase
MRVLVLYGGDSPEREVSLSSGETIAKALVESGHEAVLLDTLNGFEEIKNYIGKIDMVFPILHGINGEDGEVQKVLESLKIPFLGSLSQSSINSFDKIITHEILSDFNIRMPKFSRVTQYDFKDNSLAKSPYVLKPIKGGSSLDTQVVRSINNESESKSLKLLEKYPEMLIEELIFGKEITVPVFNNECLDVIAIVPPIDEEFNYENKYNDRSQEICPASEEFISNTLQNEAQEITLRVHKAMKARHLSRVDLMLSDNKELFVLEINTMPGMRPQSLYPKAAKNANMPMPILVKEFIKLVKDSYK